MGLGLSSRRVLLLARLANLVRGRRHTITEDIPVPSGRTDRRFQSFLEPNVIITRVVGDDINHDLNTGLVECVHHDIKVFEGTNLGVDISVVGNIIYSSISIS